MQSWLDRRRIARILQGHKPKRNFPTFEGDEVHKWLYKCNQYFDLKEIAEQDKLKLASYYLDGLALYWHQNFIRNLEGQEATWEEYVEALCCRFGGQKDPLEELTEHKQADEEDNSEEEGTLEAVNEEELTPHLSLHALQGTTGYHTIKVWGKLDKCPILILIDSGSTHNFINVNLANKHNCLLTSIKPMLVEAANGGTMACAQICKNLQWKMQGTQFQADVFVMALQNYDMVLGIQWLKLLGDILANYEDKWMTFWWQGKEVTLKGDNPTLTQSIPLEELNGLLTNTTS
uniref:Retrotransposon gag domain-containing protein n=1 Tax=Populus alba TaxID=43335 RepID=A0A4U5QXT9_POPAL|nr:hypothetical protein D5086_0000032660 [Populus alba]